MPRRGAWPGLLGSLEVEVRLKGRIHHDRFLSRNSITIQESYARQEGLSDRPEQSSACRRLPSKPQSHSNLNPTRRTGRIRRVECSVDHSPGRIELQARVITAPLRMVERVIGLQP